jgi:hypothetical protein
MMNKSVFALLAVLLAPACMFAADGQILINQSTVMTAGGFPYTITQAGSYKLSGNLIVPNGNVSAIMIAHDDVTLDLNGFSIVGPVDCSVTSNPCANSGNQMGHGIVAGTDLPAQGYFNITVRNGIISGVGADGVHLLGDSIRVEDLRIRNTGLSGILVRNAGATTGQPGDLIVSHNTVQFNGTYGIKTYSGMIADNTVSDAFVGIAVEAGSGVVARNFVLRSLSVGMNLAAGVAYSGNTLMNNNSLGVLGGVQETGGFNMGQNFCNNAVCP